MFIIQLLEWAVLWSQLIGCVAPGGVATDRSLVTLQQTTGVKVQTGGQLMLPCGNRTHTGMVQYWHTPFGQVLNDSSHGNKDNPVAMQSDGSLQINAVTQHHMGLYYCLLQDTEGMTLHPYRLHTLPAQHDHSRSHQAGAARAWRSVEAPCEEEAEQEKGERSGSPVSDGQFAGAVAASVVVTFLVGFSSGALSRAPLLRCMRGTRDKMRSLGRRRSQTTVADDQAQVTMVTLPSTSDNEAFRTDGESTLTTAAPAKPQRSFRRGKEEMPEAATYLEGCDNSERGAGGRRDSREESEEQRDSRGEREGEEGGGSEWRAENEGWVEESGSGGSYSGGGASEPEEAGSQPEEPEEAGSQSEEPEEAGSQSEGPEEAGSQPEEPEEAGSQSEGPEEAGSQPEEPEEAGSQSEGPEEAGSQPEEPEEAGSQSEGPEEAGSQSEEERGEKEEKPDSVADEGARSPPRPARRSRVIRLYQYDEEGHRYSHLSNSTPSETGPAPRLKQRSLSLTRLNAIMAAAGSSPLDPPSREAGEERDGGRDSPPKERPVFKMDI